MRATFVLALLFPAFGQVYPQKFVTFFDDAARLPSTNLAFTNEPVRSGDAVWRGTQQGLIREASSAPLRDRIQFFAGKRYLPDDDVLALAPDGAGGVWAHTRTGYSHVELRPMSLEDKAAYFEERVRARHDRYGLVASSMLREPGNVKSNQLEPSDNDGLWTAMYAAAECFRYAVTKSPEALANARKSIDAVLFLEQVTGRPGFPARSYIRKGDWRPTDGVWHWTEDGKYEWKGDTSSDEIVGHFFVFGVAYDLLPDQELKARIAATARRIMDHIIEHGYHLVDVTGKPTTWGKWSREYFEGRGKSDSALNALELLCFLKTAYHITRDEKYEKEYRKVAFELKYAEQMTRYQEYRREINYSDEELAMLPFYLAFRYEEDPKLLGFYRSALGQWWDNIRREKNPLWTFIYETSNPAEHADLDSATWMLERIPMDLVEWTVVNSNRSDIRLDGGKDRFRKAQATTLLPPDERPVMKWNSNPFRIDGGNGGRGEDDGAFYLLPYWLGRFHGYLTK
ncbi:MAG TPA: hypothetical protein VKU01_06500 [Bryobacteraceae bacterium]|nr:hypothetical protein [Bryobacteraceae bacterium]